VFTFFYPKSTLGSIKGFLVNSGTGFISLNLVASFAFFQRSWFLDQEVDIDTAIFS
jgi:hypothetical protein